MVKRVGATTTGCKKGQMSGWMQTLCARSTITWTLREAARVVTFVVATYCRCIVRRTSVAVRPRRWQTDSAKNSGPTEAQ